MEQSISTTERIAINALENVGLMPTESAVITPKQKDIFSGPEDNIGKIGMENLNSDIENQAKEETVDKKKTDPAASSISSMIPDMGEAMKNEVETGMEGNESAADTTDKSETKTKTGFVKYLKNKIEKGIYQPYGGADAWDQSKETLDQYLNKFTHAQLEDLSDLNQDNKEKELKETYRQEFFNSLPGHLKYVAQHLADETVDPLAVYASLARVEQTRQLDPSDTNDQETIARNYLTVTDFGTAEEIAEQIEEWKEANVLGKKVTTFKPKLDAMEEQQLVAYTQQAEQQKQEQQRAAEWYAGSVEEVLKTGSIGGSKIDRKKQQQLYHSLLLDMQPSPRTGQPTNAVWRKLEEIQVVKPDFDFFLEIADHILNRDEYKNGLRQEGANDQQSKITKQIKTLQGTGANSGHSIQGEQQQKRTSGVVKQKYNPFER